MARTNEYEHDFEVHCPEAVDLISYKLHICAEHVISYRTIRQACNVTTALHEDLADHLFEQLGGTQTLTAKHGKMWVRTKRSPA